MRALAALYGAAILWDLGFDTIYAHQDREDDALVGVGSTARLFGERTAAVPGGLLRRRGGAAGACRVAGRTVESGSIRRCWCRRRCCCGRCWCSTSTIRRMCLRLFRANREVGLAVAAAILLGWL